MLRPELLPPLDASQAQFHAALVAGIALVRGAFIAVAVLALASMVWWPVTRLPATTPEPRAPIPARAWWCAALVLTIGVALETPRLTSSFWWDELTSLVLVVRRGPLVIASYSANANNHILNSALMWVVSALGGEREYVLRLVPFVMSLVAVQLVFLTLLPLAGLRVAALAALTAAIHGWVTGHGTEARGYAGAILCSWVAIVCFARMLTRPTRRATLAYIAAAVLSFGFVTTSLFVPIAHGLIGLVLLVRARTEPARAIALNIVFACLWVAPLALIAFGLPLPQLAIYARTSAVGDHSTIGWITLADLVAYLAGFARAPLVVPAAIAFVVVAAIGAAAAMRRSNPDALRALMVAAVAPTATTALYLLMPGTRSSSRFFCFLVLPACVAAAYGFAWLWRRRGPYRLATAVALGAWLAALGAFQARALTVGRPDLRALGARVAGQRVAMVGAQAMLNRYYFPNAIASDSVRRTVAGADVVIEGRANAERRLATAHPLLAGLGFQIDTTIRSAVPDQTEYVVYRRGRGGRVMNSAGGSVAP